MKHAPVSKPGPRKNDADAMVAKSAVGQRAEQRQVGVPWWERNLAWLLVAPMIVMFVVFAFLPSITAIRYAFSHITLSRFGMQLSFIGFDNFARAFQDPLVRSSAQVTLKWSLMVTAIEIALGLGLALLLSSVVFAAARYSARS